MAGINRRTGKVLADGFEHACQCLEVIFTTPIGERVMRRTFGSEAPSLLGKNIVPSTFLRFATIVHVAVELWEPRLKVRQVTFPKTLPAGIRRGRIGMALLVDWRPRALKGDFTVEEAGRLIFI